MRTSEKGFATVLLITLVPVLLALGSAVFLTYSLLKQDLATMNVCRVQELDTHAKVGKLLTKLFRLNPKAKKARDKQRKAEQDLAKATATGNVPQATAASAKIALLVTERTILGIRQKAIIAAANAQLKIAGKTLSSAIQSEWQSHQRPMREWLRASLTMTSPAPPELAVRRDSPDLPFLATPYVTVYNFEQEQTWTHSWTVNYEVAGPLKTFLAFKGTLKRQCSTSLYEKGNKWEAKLNALSASKAKSWLKEWF